MIRFAARLGALILVAALASGCDESLATVAGPTPNLEPRFSSIQQLIFEAPDSSGRPACSGCHNAASGRLASGGLNLRGADAHASLVGVASSARPGAVRVIPGDAENSYLIHKIEGRSGITGQRMPRNGGPYLTEGQVQIIKRWIALGARND